MAFVVAGAGCRRRPGREIIAWCREQMANYKVPRVVEIIDELPLNATGKVAKAGAAGPGHALNTALISLLGQACGPSSSRAR